VYLIWDFDDTLAHRIGRWAGVLHTLLKRERPDHPATVEDIRQYTQSGFYWHSPELGHTHIKNAVDWWDRVYPQLELALTANHVEPTLAHKLSRAFPAEYLDISGWRLFEDVLPVIDQLSNQGWQHLILSNHVPELPDLVKGLGLAGYFQTIFNSAAIGYEKPNPKIFEPVIEYIAGARAWMIGDNFRADVEGAEAVGIPAILVRKPHDNAKRYSADLLGLPAIIGN
jgi:putative hydrolase of the HAD superfamily